MATAATGLGLGPEAFMRLLVTQLRHQDPLRPLEDREFLAQLAQLAQVERLARVEERLQAVAAAAEAGSRLEALSLAAALVGRAVELADGQRLLVVGAGPGEEGVTLVLEDGRRVGLAELRAVLAAGQP